MKRLILSRFTFLLIVLLVVSIAGCKQQQAPSPATPTKTTIINKIYANSEHNFSVEYPADWNLKKTLTENEKLTGVVAIIEGPKSAKYNYRVNIMIEADKWSRNYPVEDSAKAVELQILKKNLPDYVNLQERTTTISGMRAIVRTWTATIQSFPHKDIQAYFNKEDFTYTITYDVTTDLHDEYIDSFNLAISTFKFN